jgi:hypothetical protein
MASWSRSSTPITTRHTFTPSTATTRCWFWPAPRPAPDPSHLGLARELGARHAALRPAIERALLEHYEPYSEAQDADVPRLELPEHVWRRVAPVRVQIEPLGGVETVEIAYRTDGTPSTRSGLGSRAGR